MVSGGAPARIPHQLSGDSCGSRVFVSGTSRRHCETSHRLSNSSFLHQEAGRNKKFFIKPRGLSSLERSSVKELDSPDSPLAVNKGECNGRFSVQTPATSVGVSVIQKNLPTGSGSFPCQSNSGRVCLQGDQVVTKVHDLVSGQVGDRKGCIAAPMGPSVLLFSADSAHFENTSKDREGADRGGDDLTTVAVGTVVAPGAETHDQPHPTHTQLQDHTVHGGQVPGPALSSTTDSSSSKGKNLNFTSDPDLNNFLANHLANSTQKGYNCTFSKFASYCSERSLNPTSCNPEDIARYLMFLYENGAKYSSVNLARSAISKFHIGFDGVPAGQNKIVCNAVKAVFRLIPPLPRYVATFDVTLVLDYLKSLPANPQLSLKLLTYKTLFLLTVASISRVSSMAKLGPNLSIFKVGSLIN